MAYIKAGDRVGLAWERQPLGTVEGVDWGKGVAIVRLDAPLPTSKTGLSTRQLGDLIVLGSATRTRTGQDRWDLLSVWGRALNGEGVSEYDEMIAICDEALFGDLGRRSELAFPTGTGRKRAQDKRRFVIPQ